MFFNELYIFFAKYIKLAIRPNSTPHEKKIASKYKVLHRTTTVTLRVCTTISNNANSIPFHGIGWSARSGSVGPIIHIREMN